MKRSDFLGILLSIILFSITLDSCTSAPVMPLQLASFTENEVKVSISLEHPLAGNYLLSATFTPPDQYHLYSKDIPISGVYGMGRPTLIELTPNSHLKAIGGLTESTSAGVSGYGPQGLLIYPAGPVTLSLSVELPQGNRWVNDELKVTFMACSANLCKAPVEGKIVSIRIPGADMFGNEEMGSKQ